MNVKTMYQKPKSKQIPIHVWKEHVWNFLLAYDLDNGYSPTLWEIAEGVAPKIGKVFTGERIRQVLQEMEVEGLIKRGKNVWRGIEIIEKPNRTHVGQTGRPLSTPAGDEQQVHRGGEVHQGGEGAPGGSSVDDALPLVSGGGDSGDGEELPG